MLELLTKYKPIFETLSFLANLGLVTSLIIGIRQLKLVKKDMKDRNKRASVEKSIEYLNWFANEMIPKSAEFYNKMKAENVPIYSGPYNADMIFDSYCRIENEKVMIQIQKTNDLGSLHNSSVLHL